MKRMAVVTAILVLVAGVAYQASAQATAPQPGPPPATSPGSPDLPAPPAERGGGADVKADVKIERKDTTGSDSPSALPRQSGGGETRFLGMSPPLAIALAIGVFLVVIVAIVAMSRSGGGSSSSVHTRRVDHDV